MCNNAGPNYIRMLLLKWLLKNCFMALTTMNGVLFAPLLFIYTDRIIEKVVYTLS